LRPVPYPFVLDESKRNSDISDRAASFPGTNIFSGNPSLFAGIPMIFPVILGNQSKMERLYQEKEFIAGHMLGNEQLGNNSREMRGANFKNTLFPLICILSISRRISTTPPVF